MTTEVLTGMEALPASVTTVTANSPSIDVGYLSRFLGLEVGHVRTARTSPRTGTNTGHR